MIRRTRIDCCNGCTPPKRCAEPNCHGTCKEYLEQKAELDEANKEQLRQNKIRHDLYCQTCDKVMEANRGKRHKI